MDFLIVSATKYSKQDFEEKSLLYKSLNKLSQFNKNFETEIYYDNTNSLSKIYNNSIKTNKYDMFIFVHDDVLIEDMFLFEKLEEASKQFKMIGLAGSQKFKLHNEGTLMWLQNDNRQQCSGSVAHFHNNEYFVSCYGASKKKCLVMDGLFLAVDAKTIYDNNILFDEQFDFHFYDLDICLQFFSKKIPIGTWPISVFHKSAGSYGNKDFAPMQQKFVSKWKNS